MAPREYFTFGKTEIVYSPYRPAPTRGALRGRHGRWERDAVDAAVSQDERYWCGRRRRVVLMPRRWHQGRGVIPRTTGAKEPGPRGEHDISRKTIAQGMPADCGVPVVANACAFYTCTRGRGCTAHPAFPAPSVLIEGKRSGITPGQSRRGNAETCLNDVIARSESDEAIHSLFSTVRWIASLRSQ